MSELETDRQFGVTNLLSSSAASTDGGPPNINYGELLPADRPKRQKTGGRARGVPNKVTRDIREALRDLAEGNADRVQGWLDAVAEKEPAEAIRLYLGLLRFCLPTLSATAVANVSPKPEELLTKMSDEELVAYIVASPEAAELVKQGAVRTKDELLMRLAMPEAVLPKPNPEDDELLR
jgi:hypothetical protein